MTPELSIVVLTCNQRDFTMRLLDALRPVMSREFPRTCEIVLVDNGSQDSTAADVSKWRQDVGADCINFKYIQLDKNLGVAAGRNIGLQNASGEFLMLLDNDTIPTPKAIFALVDYLMANTTCGIVAPALYSPDGELQASAKPFPGLGIKVRHILHPGRELPCEREELLKQHPFYVIGACQTFRRSTLERVGLLDDKIFYGPEDADFCIRVRQAGLTIDYLPKIQIIHDWRRATRRSPLSRLGLLHLRALLHFYRRHRRLF